MIKRLFTGLLLALGLLLFLSQPLSQEPSITGYVMARDNNRLLVVSSQPKDLSKDQGLPAFFDMVWLSDVPEEILLGAKVSAWYGIQADSFPAQAQAERFKILPGQKLNGSTLEDQDVLNHILKKNTPELTQGLWAVQKIEYDPQEGMWTLVFVETWQDSTIEYKIEDAPLD